MAHEIKLGSNTFSINLLSASDAFDLQPLLWPAVSEALGALATLASSGKMDLTKIGEEDEAGAVEAIQKSSPVVIAAVAGIFNRLPVERLRDVRKQLLQGARCDNKELFSAQGDTFEVIMRGRTLDTWRLLIWALRCNYPDFFDLVGDALTAAKEKSSTSPTDSDTVTP